jgi:cation transport ATPase
MLIDNSDDSNSIQNVSYLVPIGAFLYIIFASLFNLLKFVLVDAGLRMKFEQYLNYWAVQIGVTTLLTWVIYAIARRIWRRILSGQYNCARLFVSLFIATIVVVASSFFLIDLHITYFRLTSEEGLNITSDYISYKESLYPYISTIEMVILILALTLGFRSSAKKPMREQGKGALD